jgi:hypothetical protein
MDHTTGPAETFYMQLHFLTKREHIRTSAQQRGTPDRRSRIHAMDEVHDSPCRELSRKVAGTRQQLRCTPELELICIAIFVLIKRVTV